MGYDNLDWLWALLIGLGWLAVVSSLLLRPGTGRRIRSLRGLPGAIASDGPAETCSQLDGSRTVYALDGSFRSYDPAGRVVARGDTHGGVALVHIDGSAEVPRATHA